MWIRRIEVTVTNSTTKAVLLQTHQNRIDFSYQGSLAWEADQLKLDIYNLGLREVRSLIDSGKDGRDILVRVGYEDDIENMATLMDGVVVNAHGMKQLPHHITSLWCIPKWARNLDKVHDLQAYTTDNSSLKKVLTDLTALAGFKTAPIFIGVPDDVLAEVVPGSIFNGDVRSAFRGLGEQYGFFTRNAGDGLRIISHLNNPATLAAMVGSPTAKSHKLQINKVRGTPQAQPSLITIPYNLDANLRCGDIIDVSNFIVIANINAEGLAVQNQVGGPSVSGIIQVNDPEDKLYRTDTLWEHTIMERYILKYVNHYGSNFTNAWQSTLTGIVYSGSRKGPEANGGSGWQDDLQNKVQGTVVPSVQVSFQPSQHSLNGGPNQGIFNTEFQEGNGLTRAEAQKLNTVKISPTQQASIMKAAGGNYQKAQALTNKLKIENRGNNAPVNATSKAGAQGPWQLMPKTAASLGVTDVQDFEQGAHAAGKLYDDAMQRWHGNRALEYADYNAGPTRAGQMAEGASIPRETQDYVRMAMAMEAQQNGGE
jgi:hypothetical protein